MTDMRTKEQKIADAIERLIAAAGVLAVAKSQTWETVQDRRDVEQARARLLELIAEGK